jgi:hypothetical protein
VEEGGGRRVGRGVVGEWRRGVVGEWKEGGGRRVAEYLR